MNQFYYLNDEKQPVGPLGEAELGTLLQANAISEETLVALSGEEEWSRLGDRIESGPSLPKVPGVTPPAALTAGKDTISMSFISRAMDWFESWVAIGKRRLWISGAIAIVVVFLLVRWIGGIGASGLVGQTYEYREYSGEAGSNDYCLVWGKRVTFVTRSKGKFSKGVVTEWNSFPSEEKLERTMHEHEYPMKWSKFGRKVTVKVSDDDESVYVFEVASDEEQKLIEAKHFDSTEPWVYQLTK